jgi:hypothetical protein
MAVSTLSTTAATSPRVALARLAHDVALDVRSVVATNAGTGGAFATSGGRERVPGVVCIAAGEVYDLELHLVTEPVPLHPLAGRVRARIEKAAVQAGLGGLLGSIDVVFVDVRERTPEDECA